jgi:pimeloyl-ACP methyl ester carboxylesterase
MLAYAITGDPSGKPVFYCHGWPASRLEAALIPDLPVRLIAMDRPGYGASTRQPGRTLLDWPADVVALADHLGIGRFHVVGVSGGAPYALACAAALPRVAGAALVSPLPPLRRAHMPPAEGLAEGLQRLRDLGERPMLGAAIINFVRLGVRIGLFNPYHVLDSAAAGLDGACLTQDRRSRLVEAWHEGLRQGGSGAASDARIYVSDWGIDFTAIQTRLTIWQGGADKVVPPTTLSAYADLPATRHLLPREGHYSLALSRSAEILADLVAPPDQAAAPADSTEADRPRLPV